MPFRGVGAQGLAPLRWFIGTAFALSLCVSLALVHVAAAASISLPFGDVDCSGTITSVDSLRILRHSAGFPEPQMPPCRVGDGAMVDGVSRIWGDNDCSGAVNAVDALKTLRQLAALSYVQNEPCPDIDSTVQADFGQ